MKSEGLVESIRHRLMTLSRANGEAFDFVLARYGVERFLYRLSQSEHADRFVLKGAMLFHVWNRKMHRPTRDLDLLGFGADDLESVRQSILDVLRTGVADDGLSFREDTLVVEPIREDLAYGGVRAKLLAKLGNIRIPVQVDVGFGDAITPGPDTKEFPALLSGFPTAFLKAYPVATVIAEKFEALVRLDAQNSRMKDFFDLDVLLTTFELDQELLSKAIHATFERREASLPVEEPTGLTLSFAYDKQVMWQAFLRKNGLVGERDDFAEVVSRIRHGLSWLWEM